METQGQVDTDCREDALELLGHSRQASAKRDHGSDACRFAVVGDDVERRFTGLCEHGRGARQITKGCENGHAR